MYLMRHDALKAYAGVQVECTAVSPHIPNLGTKRTKKAGRFTNQTLNPRETDPRTHIAGGTPESLWEKSLSLFGNRTNITWWSNLIVWISVSQTFLVTEHSLN
jgi:hypothetical protein